VFLWLALVCDLGSGGEYPVTLVGYFVILFVVLAVVFGLTVAVAALTGWWIEFAGEDRAGECQMGKGGE
jgi:hypothetical protein